MRTRKTIEYTISLLAVGLICAPALSFGKSSTLEQARAAVKSNMASEEGQRYDARAGAEFSDQTASALPKCVQSVAGSDAQDFDLFIKIAGDGSVKEVLTDPSTQLSQCVRRAVLHGRFSTPPQPGYWVRAEIKIKN